MTDTYSSMDNVVKWYNNQRKATISTAMDDLDDDPDQAARAVQLSKVTGTPAPIINQDVEQHALQLRKEATANILSQNEVLRRWAEEDPMASKVASDDWSNLDKTDRAVERLSKFLPRKLAHGLFADNRVTTAFGTGFVQGFDTSRFSWADPVWDAKPFGHFAYTPALALDILGELPARAFSAGMSGLHAGLKQLHMELGGDEQTSERFARDVTGGVEGALMSGGADFHIPEVPTEIGVAQRLVRDFKSQGDEVTRPMWNKIVEAGRKAKPYLEKGEEVPAGLSPLLDQYRASLAEMDSEYMTEAEKAADASLTKTRAPDTFKNLPKLRANVDVEIDADAVRQLYGDKKISPDDKLLGWIPDLEKQLQDTETFGDVIKVPLNEWLTHASPEVKRALKDRYTPRKHGDTPAEAKQLAQPSTLDETVQPPFSNDDVGRTKEALRSQKEATNGEKQSEKRVKYEPPPQPDNTARFYHGGDEPTTGGGRWVTPDLEYARNYRTSEGRTNNVHYVDVPIGHPFEQSARMWDATDEQIKSNVVGRYRHAEAPEEIAKQLKPYDMVRSKEKPTTRAQQMLLPGTVHPDDLPPFEPGSIMPKARQQKYLKAAEAQRQDEQAFIDKKVEEQAAKRIGKQWLDRATELYAKVKADVENIIPWQVSQYFRKGILYGEKQELPKIDPKWLTKEQKQQFPKQWLKKGGQNPDDIANLFGVSSGSDLIDGMVNFEIAKGEQTPKQLLDYLVGTELTKRLEAELGKPADLIMEEVRDHQYGSKNLDLLHEDTVAMAWKADQQLPMSKKDFARQARLKFGGLKLTDANYPAANRALYRAANKLEDAILAGDFREAYKQAQRKELAHLIGMEVKKLNKEVKSFDRLMSKYGKRNVENVDPEATNMIHWLMNRVNEYTGRTNADIDREIQASQFKDIRDFVEQKVNDGYIMEVPDFLLDPTFRKEVDDMSVEEFRGLHDSIKSIDAYSRQRQQQVVAGQTWDFHELRDAMIQQLDELPTKKHEMRIDIEPSAVAQTLKSVWAQHLQMEAIFNRFDRNNPMGIFNQGIVRKYASAANHVDARGRQLANEWKALTPVRDANKAVSQNIFIDPRTGQYLKMSRMNILAILQNMGNPSNFYAMLDGYKIDRARAREVMDLVERNTTVEDVNRAKSIGNMFDKLKNESDNMYRELSGIAPTRVEPWTVNIHGGEVEGWYHPLIYDKEMPQNSPKLAAPNPLEFPHWTKSSLPGAGFTKERTGYTGPLDLRMDAFRGRQDLMIKDTTWRPVLTELNQIFKDPKFRTAIQRNMGPQYVPLLDTFLQDIKGNNELLDKNASIGYKAIQFMRQNIISFSVGLNPVTFAKHNLTALVQSIAEAGIGDFSKALFTLWGKSPEATESNWAFAMNRSEELQRRHRNMVDVVSGNFDRTFGDLRIAPEMRSFLNNFKDRPVSEGIGLALGDVKAGLMRFRDTMHWIGAAPLAAGDLLSAVPTWLAVYKRSIEKGYDEGNAVFFADRSVRRAHGSTAITNRAQLMRTNPFAASFVSFYTFFNHILMRQYEMAWAARAGLKGDGYFVQEPSVNRDTMDINPPTLERGTRERMVEQQGEYKKTDEYKSGAFLIPSIAGMFVAYVIMPSLIEEFVDPQHGEKGMGPQKEGYPTYLSLMELEGLSGSYLGIRDYVHAFMHGGDVGGGLFTTQQKEMLKLMRTQHLPHSLKEKEDLIRGLNANWNMLTGLGMPNSVPRAGVFGYNWYMGKDHPQNVRQWWTGVTKGTSHPRHHR